MRIAFVKDWHDDLEHLAGNKDGILAAFGELEKRYNVEFISRHNCDVRWMEFFHGCDVIICWGSLDRPWHAQLPKGIPKILCFAGGPTEHENLKNFDHVCVESQVYLEAFKRKGVSVSRAFGTNSDVFRPEPRSPKVFRAIYPASFCFHKNIELFARAMRGQGLAVGNWNEESVVSKCLELGLPIMRRVSSDVLSDLYNMSRCTVVPCGTDGGAQRVVLESMACGVPVVLANDNDKCREFVEESGCGVLVPPIAEAIREAVDELTTGPYDPSIGRKYIEAKWTHHHYANALEEAIKFCWTAPHV